MNQTEEWQMRILNSIKEVEAAIAASIERARTLRLLEKV